MKKINLLFVLMLFVFSVSADIIDIAWETPEITSKNYSSILEENREQIEIPLDAKENHSNSESYFALQNWPNFKSAFSEFFTSTEKKSSFLSYHSKKKMKDINFQDDLDLSLETRNYLQSQKKPMNSGFDFKLVTGYDYFSNSDQYYDFLYYGIKLSGDIEDKLFFYTNFWAGHFSGDEEYIDQSSLKDSWTQRSDDSTQVYLDNVSGKLLYQIKPYWSAAIGRGKYEIGNNIGGSIILNDDCNDYGYFATKFDFSKFYVHFLHASLIADSTLADYKDYPDKYLAVHKFGWKPNDDFELFWGEHVVYGDRSIDPSYLIPFTYWRGTEHNLSDRDNVFIFAGFNFRPFKRDLIYTNAIFDEFSKSKFFGNWWGNKYAVQIGNSYQFDRNKNNRITMEFTAIRPWLYTHKYIQNKFSNDDVGLGFPLGSNLLNFALEINWEFKRNLSGNLHTSFTRQGSVGNDFSINYDSRPSDSASWLEGNITDYKRAKFIVDWKPLSHHRLRVGISALQIDEADIEKELSISYQASY
ncbi:MAG: hypothetical protein Q7J16_00385 [Candidatus Cloacimonadales bacterium]|nr:hypothetical protein [Candidatus Cloacimonadales bacterium]